MKKISLCMALMCLFTVNIAHADGTARPDAHAPIGVMGEHMHKKGEWMTSYRYMKMDMPEIYDGSHTISSGTVTNPSDRGYMVTPLFMKMHMHMVGAMYGVTDEFTAMLMVPYIVKDMEHRNRAGNQFSTHAAGIGDIKLSGLFSLKEFFNTNVILNMGVGLPTGSIDRQDRTLAGPDQHLPYPMQLGSGTIDILPGLTYYDSHDDLSWGGQVNMTLRNGSNDAGYTLGNIYEVTAWSAYQWLDWLSTSARLKYSYTSQIDGSDSRINPNMIPTADASNQGGERIDILFGFNMIAQEGLFKDHRLAFEFGIPVYQDLNGPQLGVGFHGTVGWQLAF